MITIAGTMMIYYFHGEMKTKSRKKIIYSKVCGKIVLAKNHKTIAHQPMSCGKCL